MHPDIIKVWGQHCTMDTGVELIDHCNKSISSQLVSNVFKLMLSTKLGLIYNLISWSKFVKNVLLIC